MNTFLDYLLALPIDLLRVFYLKGTAQRIETWLAWRRFGKSAKRFTLKVSIATRGASECVSALRRMERQLQLSFRQIELAVREER